MTPLSADTKVHMKRRGKKRARFHTIMLIRKVGNFTATPLAVLGEERLR